MCGAGSYPQDARLHRYPVRDAGVVVGGEAVARRSLLPFRPHAPHPHEALPPALRLLQPRAQRRKIISGNESHLCLSLLQFRKHCQKNLSLPFERDNCSKRKMSVFIPKHFSPAQLDGKESSEKKNDEPDFFEETHNLHTDVERHHQS